MRTRAKAAAAAEAARLETANKVLELKLEISRLWDERGRYWQKAAVLMFFALAVTLALAFWPIQALFWCAVVLFVAGIAFSVRAIVLGFRVNALEDQIHRLDPEARVFTSNAEELGRALRAGLEARRR